MIPTRELNDGTTIPAIGFGNPSVDEKRGEELYGLALDAGYRLIDTAQAYGTEGVVGRAVNRSSVPREEIRVQTKVPGRDHGYAETLKSFDRSRVSLGLDYVDIYLIHWPNPGYDKYVDTWRAMIELRHKGLVRTIGVCNFTSAFIERLWSETGVLPAINQIERHPLFPNADQLRFDADRGIATESWSPLGRGHAFIAEQAIVSAAAAHGVTPGQIVLRWQIQGGSVPIPFSTRPERIHQNLDVFGFELTDEEMAAISGLESGRIWGQDPSEIDYL
ncbi:MAG TPA: aldo/keto reductase [Candidatus Limnocylindrales bacterium]